MGLIEAMSKDAAAALLDEEKVMTGLAYIVAEVLKHFDERTLVIKISLEKTEHV